MAYKQIYIDIAGCCNAKCKWCVTGRKNMLFLRGGGEK